jgi:PAS domain S-box-containing protein
MPVKIGSLKRLYLLSIGTMALLILVSQVILQAELTNEVRTSQIISTADEQRLLSQQVIQKATHTARTLLQDQSLSTLLDSFERTHQNLTVGTLSYKNTDAVQALFQEIEPFYQDFLEAGRCIASSTSTDLEVPQCEDSYSAQVEKLQTSADAFLPRMNRIVAQLDQESASDINKTRIIEASISTIKIVILAIMGFSILRPAVQSSKEAQETVARSEWRYKLMAETVSDIISRHSADGDFLYVSPAVKTLLGYDPEELIGLSIRQFLHPEDVEGVENAHARTPHIDSVTSRFRLRNKEGDFVWFEASQQYIRNPKTHDIQEIMVVSREITARKLAEDALKTNEARFRAMNDASPFGIFMTDAQGVCLYTNALYQEITGVSSEAALGHGWKSTIHMADYLEITSKWQEATQQQATFTSIIRFMHSDGNIIWGNMKAAPIQNANTLLGYVGTVENITERKQADEALQESQKFIQSAAEVLPDLLYIYDMVEHRYAYSNRGIADLLGYGLEEIESLGWQLLGQIIHPDDLPQLDAHVQELQSLPDGAISEYEFRAKHQNGDWRWLYSRDIVLSRLEDGRLHQYLGVAQDFTERKQTEEQLRHAQQAAESANKAKSIFLANMSHELRTPLNAILGFAQLMAADHGLDKEKHENLETILRSGEYLSSLINNVLEMSKIEAGRITLNRINFELPRLLIGLEDMMMVRAAGKGLQLYFEGLSHVPRYISTDENKLRQILLNLLSNAIKFTAEGGVILRVRYDAKQDVENEGCLAFEVQDTGSGIGPEELTELFKPFHQTTTGRRSQEGTGLGLAITQQFVEILGGKIQVESQVNKGSTFRFSIPVVCLEHDDVSAQEQKRLQRVVGLVPGQPSYRILIAEDKDENRRLLVKLMQAVGFDVREALNGQETVEIVKSWHPHLVWMDIDMPLMNGMEATRTIKAYDKSVIVIALTASAFEHERRAVMDAGCDDFLPKPFQTFDMFELLRQYLKVEFTYTLAQDDTGAAANTFAAILTSNRLKEIPTELFQRLKQASLKLDSRQTYEVIEDLYKVDAPLAGVLKEVVKSFRFDKIQNLIEECEQPA